MGRKFLVTVIAAAAVFCWGKLSAGEVVIKVNPIPVPQVPNAPGGEKAKGGEDKPKGPEHNVILNEESGVLDLLAKAHKARERAEADAQVWPECVKLYAEILRKYPNSVYLDRWEGDGLELAGRYKDGLYKSTRERVAAEIAALPPAGLAIYRVVNDPIARALFTEAQEQFNERKMEQVVQDHLATSCGANALLWLGEMAYNRGAARQALSRFAQLLKLPNAGLPRLALQARMLLAQIQAGDRVAAEAALKQIAESADLAKLRLGHDEGPAALAKFKRRIDAMEATDTVARANNDRDWETYFGNAAHNRLPANRENFGVLKNSVDLMKLIRGPDYDSAQSEVVVPDNNMYGNGNFPPPEMQNQHLTVREPYFYLCDKDRIAVYPVSDPRPGPPPVGNAKFFWPGEIDIPAKGNKARRFNGVWMANARRHHPYFCTLGGDRVFVAIGPEPPIADANMGMAFNQQENKYAANALVALGWRSGKLLWSLESGSAAFQNQSKADQEWLRSVYFASAPVYENGMLYAEAVVPGGSNEAWAAAFDAEDGHLEWRTQICAGSLGIIGGSAQPDLGLPVAVAQGRLFVVTNLGAVASLDAGTGVIKWIRIYDRQPAQINHANPWEARNMQGSFWAPNPPIVKDNQLIVTPQDSDVLYCYDVQTGARLWEISRLDDRDEKLKHILGITHNTLVLSGTNQLHFYDLSGRKAAESITLDSPIKGRGVATRDMVLVPTEKSLVSIALKTENGRLSAQRKDSHPWGDPAAEAGNVFIAGDVLYTISSTRLNAFFDPAEMEHKLRDRITEQPNDPNNYLELADAYFRMQPQPRLKDALKELDSGLKVANDRRRDEPKSAAVIPALLTKKFETFFALGEQARKPAAGAPDPAAAFDFFKQALETSLLPELAPDLPVRALQAMAETCAARDDLAGAVQQYQRILVQHGDVLYGVESSAVKARLFAQERIEKLKHKDPRSYAAVETEAVAALTAAGDDTGKLEALLTQFPNADAAGAALVKLARLSLAAQPGKALQYCQRFLRAHRNSPEAAGVTALLAVACEHARQMGTAKDLLSRLATRPAFAGKTMAFDPADLKNSPAAPLQAADWARRRLAEPQFQRAISSANWSLGGGNLKEAWSQPAPAQSQPLSLEGLWPVGQRGNLFFVEDQQLAVLSGATGAEVWKPRPKLPGGSGPRGVWAGQMLVLWGEKELVALDANDNGKIAWRRNHVAETNAAPCAVVGCDQRLVVEYPNGLLAVLDALSGNELWHDQLEGKQPFGSPVCGEGFVAAATQNPAKVFVFDLETGARHCANEVVGGMSVQPCVAGDRVYYCDNGNLIHALDGTNGKQLWQHPCEGAVSLLRASRDLVVAVVNQRNVLAIGPDGAGQRKTWAALVPANAAVRNVLIDGDDLYVASSQQNRTEIDAFSIPAQGKFLWPVEAGSEQNWLDSAYLATGHFVVAQSSSDPNTRADCIVLVDRRTGKRVFDAQLSVENRVMLDQAGRRLPAFQVNVFEGGLVIVENGKRTAYVATDAGGSSGAELPDLKAKLAANPKDVELRIKLAALQYEKGERAEALASLSSLLAEGGLSEEKFSAAYDKLALLRKDFAGRDKPVFTFVKVDKAPALDGALEGWPAGSETVLDGWRNVFLAEAGDGAAAGKKPLWKGPADLKVAFRGAFDAKQLYLMFVVTDDKHVNEQTVSNHCDLGDSVTLAFDIDRDGGRGYRGKDFALGLALGKDGKTLFHRWVERGHYVMGENAPLAATVKVVRKENEKQTVYQLALPLEYLSLPPEEGRKFGFSFCVNDQDDSTALEKGLAASPGLMGEPHPALFAEGQLEK